MTATTPNETNTVLAQSAQTDGFHLVIDALKLNGIDTIFGLPGIPITDLTRMAHSSIRKQYSVLYNVTAEYLGGPVEQRLELARLVSPLNHASPSTAPTLIIHGDADPIVPVEESIIFYDSLKKFGVDATLHRVATGTHDLFWATYGAEVMEFFRRTLTN